MDDRPQIIALGCGCALCRSAALQRVAIKLEEMAGSAENDEDGLALMLFAAARIAREHGMSEDDFADMCQGGYEATKAEKPKGLH